MNTKYKHSLETREKISQSLKGRKAWNKGLKCPWIGKYKKKYFNEPKKCQTCEKIFYRRENEISNNWIKRKYCSIKCCYERNNKQNKICEWCKNEFYPKYHRKGKNFVKKRFCNIKCVVSWRENQYKSGLIKRVPSSHKFGHKEENPNWKNGITSMIEKVRKSKKYKRWRNDIFERDDFTCRECKKRGGDINVHHIKRLSEIFGKFDITTYKKAVDDENIWDLNNGVTLCKNCHKKTF